MSAILWCVASLSARRSEDCLLWHRAAVRRPAIWRPTCLYSDVHAAGIQECVITNLKTSVYELPRWVIKTEGICCSASIHRWMDLPALHLRRLSGPAINRSRHCWPHCELNSFKPSRHKPTLAPAKTGSGLWLNRQNKQFDLAQRRL